MRVDSRLHTVAHFEGHSFDIQFEHFFWSKDKIGIIDLDEEELFKMSLLFLNSSSRVKSFSAIIES